MNFATRIWFSTLFLILIIYPTISTRATTYYVSNSGNNGPSGTSPDAAWKNIATVNTKTFSPGDSILFKCGDTWREELKIKNSGEPDAPIVYASYGVGPKPRIYGSNRAEEWSAVDGHPNIWKSETKLAAPRERTGNSVTNHPSSIFFGEMDGSITWGNMEKIHLNNEGAPTDIYQGTEVGEEFSLMNEEYDWCWQENHIFVYAAENPGTRYAFIEVPQRVAAIQAGTHPPAEHVVIDGFELMYTLKYGYNDGWPMNVEVRGLTIKNCHIGYMGVKSAAAAIGLQIWHSDMLVQNNDVHDCGRRAISFNIYTDVRSKNLVFENVVFENNVLHNGYHTTGFDIASYYTDTFRNFVFRHNFIWDDPTDDPTDQPNDFTSMGMYLQPGKGTLTDFKIYNNVFKYTKQKGIACAGLKNSDICYNTFYGMNVKAGGSGYRGMLSISGDVENVNIKNNVFYGNVKNEYILRCVHFSGASYTGATLDHNLYFQENSNQVIVNIDGKNSFSMSSWNFYKGVTGWDDHSPEPANPLFVNAPDDLRLTDTSPAVEAAEPLSWITTDFLGNPRDPLHPDAGAFEYVESNRAQNNDSNLDMTYQLYQNYPNPFNASTRISYYLPKESDIDFNFYNAVGQAVRSRSLGRKSIGDHEFTFNAKDFSSGVYFYEIRSAEFSSVKKCIILK